MVKLYYENRLNLYTEKKNEILLSNFIIKYKVKTEATKYIVKLFDKSGFNIIKTTKIKKYSIH